MPNNLAEQAIQRIQACYQQLHAQRSNVVKELLKNHEVVFQWDHYPKGDVRDVVNHSQYYYHSHPSHDASRVPEHGHFHLFLRQTAFSACAQPLKVSEKYKQNPKKDALCHVVAIAMDDHGFPSALFTVNHWVVQGLWYSAKDIASILERFKIDLPTPSSHTNQWLTAMVQLFHEPIKELLHVRDEVINDWQKQYPHQCAFSDKRLEVTSICRLPGNEHLR